MAAASRPSHQPPRAPPPLRFGAGARGRRARPRPRWWRAGGGDGGAGRMAWALGARGGRGARRGGGRTPPETGDGEVSGIGEVGFWT